MRHPIKGTPYVPPTCPAEQRGDIPNLGAASFTLHINLRLDLPSEIYGTFYPLETGENGEVTAKVSTDKFQLPPKHPVERNTRRLLGAEPGTIVSTGLPSTDNLAAEYMRVIFCGRVANCQGVINGECWALGAKAIKEVIEETLGD